jgi:hypothetical protein
VDDEPVRNTWHSSVRRRRSAKDSQPGTTCISSKKKVDLLGVLLFRVERVIGLADQADIPGSQVVEPVVNEIQVKDVLSRDT